MKDLVENNLVRFKGIKKKKDRMFADFKVRGIKGATTYSASISVDLSEAEVHPCDSLETIIEACAKVALREYQKSDVQFEGLEAI